LANISTPGLQAGQTCACRENSSLLYIIYAIGPILTVTIIIERESFGDLSPSNSDIYEITLK